MIVTQQDQDSYLPPHRPTLLHKCGGGRKLCVAGAMKSQAQARQLAGLPTLPVEVLSRVVFNLSAAASEGEPSALRTLARLSVVSHLVREWALQALYTILVLPRHVRDFRKWYERMRTSFPPFPCARHVKGLFIGIDDVRTTLPNVRSHD